MAESFIVKIATHQHAQVLNITADIARGIPISFNGACLVFCRHTTAGLTINENTDPNVGQDILAEFERLIPWENANFRHGEGNSAAHVKASLMGASVMVPIVDGHLELGTWQGIFFCEFDGPRSRRVAVQLLG